MLGTQDLTVFIIAGLLLNLTPGADTLFIVGRSASQGTRAGVIAALGIGAGCLVHVAAASVGISALLAASSSAFTTIKLIGAAYLAYLGVSMLFTRKKPAAAVSSAAANSPLRAIFWQGFLTNVLNPKVALFFLAFLPQFIAPHAQDKWLSMLFLGIVFDVNGTLWNLFLAWSAAHFARRMSVPGGIARWLNRACGALFLYFSVRLLKLNTR